MANLSVVTKLCSEKLTISAESSQQRKVLFGNFAVRFTANYGEPLGDARAAFFEAELRDVDTAILEKAFTWVLNHVKKYGSGPTLADLREGVEAVKSAEAIERHRQDYLLESEAERLLPGPTWKELCDRGEQYRTWVASFHKSVKSFPLPEPNEDQLCVATRERLEELARQAEQVKQKYLPRNNPASSAGARAKPSARLR